MQARPNANMSAQKAVGHVYVGPIVVLESGNTRKETWGQITFSRPVIFQISHF